MIPDYKGFADAWEAAWNAHDLDRIMAHYTDDIVFRSRKAFPHLGLGELRGKDQLRLYWAAALASQPDLKFEVQTVLGGHKMAVVVYRNHKGVTAADSFFFSAHGQVEMAAACHENWQFPNPYRIQVDLWIKPGRERAFADYEEQAFAAMTTYGGRLIEIDRQIAGPDERHILEFPSKQAFDAYRSGPEAVAAKPVRDNCVDRTELTEIPENAAEGN